MYYEKRTFLANKSTAVNKKNNHFSPQIIVHKELQNMAFEIQFLSWDRHKKCE
jgi:hypothetical protein